MAPRPCRVLLRRAKATSTATPPPPRTPPQQPSRSRPPRPPPGPVAARQTPRAPADPRSRPAKSPPLAPQADCPRMGLEAGHRPGRVRRRGPRARRQPCRPPSPVRPTVTPPPPRNRRQGGDGDAPGGCPHLDFHENRANLVSWADGAQVGGPRDGEFST